MVEAGVTVGRSRAWLLDEADEFGVGAEGGETVLAGQHAQPDDALPVFDRTFEVGDRQLDGPHVRVRRDLRHASTIAPSALIVLESGFLLLRLREGQRAAAHLRVQLVLDRVDV